MSDMSVEAGLQKLKDDLDCLVTATIMHGDEEDAHIEMINAVGVDVTTPQGAVSLLAANMITSLLVLLAEAYTDMAEDEDEEEITALELWRSGKHN